VDFCFTACNSCGGNLFYQKRIPNVQTFFFLFREKQGDPARWSGSQRRPQVTQIQADKAGCWILWDSLLKIRISCADSRLVDNQLTK